MTTTLKNENREQRDVSINLMPGGKVDVAMTVDRVRTTVSEGYTYSSVIDPANLLSAVASELGVTFFSNAELPEVTREMRGYTSLVYSTDINGDVAYLVPPAANPADYAMARAKSWLAVARDLEQRAAEEARAAAAEEAARRVAEANAKVDKIIALLPHDISRTEAKRIARVLVANGVEA